MQKACCPFYPSLLFENVLKGLILNFMNRNLFSCVCDADVVTYVVTSGHDSVRNVLHLLLFIYAKYTIIYVKS